MELKNYIAESLNKEHGYRIKFAADCGTDHMDMLEKCLAKYNLVSATPFKRTPIAENPIEFYRVKGTQCTSEVCSTDVILQYPVNERILEVWCAVNMGLDHERVLAYNVKDPRRIESEMAEMRAKEDKDRQVSEEDALLNDENMEHYEAQNEEIDFKANFFGEEYNKKFLDELAKIKKEKGPSYFSNYPTKEQLMGKDLEELGAQIHGMPNMGRGTESQKQVSNHSQALKGIV
ncbi:hypothetical protein N9J02_00745 [bacterium]|nr:hypothetical protein [bacterium]